MEKTSADHRFAGSGTGKKLCPCHQYQWRVMEIFIGRYHPVHFTETIPDKSNRQVKTLYQCFGEEVIVDNTDKAIAMAREKTGAVVNDYTAAPVYFSETSNGAHEWLIEFEKEPASLDAFTNELDTALKNINSDYEAKRHKRYCVAITSCSFIKKRNF